MELLESPEKMAEHADKHFSPELDEYDPLEEEWCEIDGCESPAMDTVPVSVEVGTLGKRNLCYPCSEAYMIGCQYANLRDQRILAAAQMFGAASAIAGVLNDPLDFLFEEEN
jgi:hypothetical protein